MNIIDRQPQFRPYRAYAAPIYTFICSFKPVANA